MGSEWHRMGSRKTYGIVSQAFHTVDEQDQKIIRVCFNIYLLVPCVRVK